MEKELNIAAILNEKPTETKLWSPMLGDCIYCYNNTYPEEIIIAFTDKNGEEREWTFSYSGRTISAPDTAEVCLFPSKQMQDWSKFAWKKGDVLVSNDGKREVLFKTWENDSYTKFVGFHCLIINDNEEVEYDNGTTVFSTNDFKGIEAEDVAQTYINTIEERFCGKLNLETLEIEKQHEFKDGDIVFYENPDDEDVCSSIFIFRGKQNHTPGFLYHAALNSDGFFNAKDGGFGIYEGKSRLATDSEKQQLFSALAKEGKRWNPDTKQIEDLSKGYEFKAFDKVLVRDFDDREWKADFFSHNRLVDDPDYRFSCVGNMWRHCIPYNEETAHLLGTSDEWKGGE